MKFQRVGVFDSGRGGEIMTDYLSQEFPAVEFVFRDDQANAPYGEKSPEQIYQLAVNMVNKLVAEKVEAIVVACHTISSTCFPEVEVVSPVPLLSVNEALLADLLTEPISNRIGLLATTATVRTNWFPQQLEKFNPEAQVYSVACPGLATAIDAKDEGWIDQLLDECLGQLPLSGIDTLALACTHYPVVKQEISRKIPSQIQILDAQRKIAEKMRHL